MSEDIEYVLLNKKEVMVYNVPPATSASGYRASEWSNCIWKGKLQVCAKGDILIIKLLDASSGAIFAACPIAPNQDVEKVLERTVDSSRYFVLTMTDKSGRKAHLGMGFDDRNDAFDFNAAVQDFRRQSTPVAQIDPVVKKVDPAPTNLSLKEGQKLSIQLKVVRPPPVVDRSSFVPLPPPPASKARQATPHSDSPDLLGVGVSAPSVQRAEPIHPRSLLDD